jgi:hypothetical protein
MDKLICTTIILVAIVSLIVGILTELTKRLPYLKKMPTILQVMITSIALWIIIYYAACDMGFCIRAWYVLCASVVLGITSAYGAAFGWKEFYVRIKKYVLELIDIAKEHYRGGGAHWWINLLKSLLPK